jgi:hypothetical protein
MQWNKKNYCCSNSKCLFRLVILQRKKLPNNVNIKDHPFLLVIYKFQSLKPIQNPVFHNAKHPQNYWHCYQHFNTQLLHLLENVLKNIVAKTYERDGLTHNKIQVACKIVCSNSYLAINKSYTELAI